MSVSRSIPANEVVRCHRPLVFLAEWDSRSVDTSPGTTFQWQLGGGQINLNVNAAVYDIDLTEAKDSDISTLHSRGRKVICYFSAGTWEDYRHDVSGLPQSVLGNRLENWPHERYWDIRAQAVRDVIRGRLDLAKQRGCDAVDPDNVDSYANNNGLRLTRTDQLFFNKWLAGEAHTRGLSVGLKNAVDLVQELEPSFDWALNEGCVHYNECGVYQAFLSHNKAVFHVEYVDNHNQGASKRTSVCNSPHRPVGFTSLIKDWDLTDWYIAC
ncbi:uncharacterized protein LOC112563954 [Pomacea canaliculata]|uniref:uncharacterized protein LOC112563954 n=1 Tax=Pomacea canaliculata TaxID=400727 RepID=UPI000D72C95D|nr:uncharacterized protein LOC112563954 [Pomacea canaliculata]